MQSPEVQLEELKRGAENLLVENELLEKLKRSHQTKKPLVIKAGFDPTAPDIHLGHTVCLQKLSQFQKLGHDVVFLIGDFTGLVGDPSGKSKARPQLTREEVKKNAETYKIQVFKILDPKRTQVKFNSEWLDTLSSYDFVRLAAHANVARMLERDDFGKRYRSGQSIGLHEFLYPLLQAYDSVALKADVELGGRDQLFNFLLGRELMKDLGMEPQICLTMPLLEGLDGEQKMSKTLNNYVGVTESPDQIYGKLMSLPDRLLRRYFDLLSGLALKEVQERFDALTAGRLHPKQLKSQFAIEMVARYHSMTAAHEAAARFEKIFSQKQLPEDIPVVSLKRTPGPIWIPKLLVDIDFASSTSEGKRLVQQGAVRIDETPIQTEQLTPSKNEFVLQVGKRKFIRIKLN